jgi:hypothetical protein
VLSNEIELLEKKKKKELSFLDGEVTLSSYVIVSSYMPPFYVHNENNTWNKKVKNNFNMNIENLTKIYCL